MRPSRVTEKLSDRYVVAVDSEVYSLFFSSVWILDRYLLT